MRVDRAREAALDALAACRRNGAWIDGALKQVLKRDGLSGRDAAFASRIAYGVMQSRIYLDRCLARCLTQRPEKLEPLLLDILRVGAYQILLMDKVPVNAAVNEAVEMAKAHKLSRAAGLVNAVLRNVDRRRGEPLAFADELEALSVQTSHPRALVERMVGLLGAEEAEAFLRADNEPVPTTIQTNTLKTTAKQLRASLEDEGVTVEPHPWLADCFTVSGTGDVTLSVFQSIPLSGIVVVASPQELVGMVVEKAVKMAEKMAVPIVGLVENMSYLVCPDCGRKIYLFGEGRSAEAAKKHGIPLLAQMPIDPQLAALTDEGRIEEFKGDWLADAVTALEAR